jgi:nucleotide-binding universal stress UspA family protein
MEERGLFAHVLVPTDGSENSIHAGRLAVRMASTYHSQLTLLYVVDSAIVDELAGATSKSAEMIRQELEAKGRSYLDYIVRLARNNDVQCDQAIRYGIPYREIADLARERRVDLIVIGRVGCRGPRCALIGSVAERVIEYADCSVLVVGQNLARR